MSDPAAYAPLGGDVYLDPFTEIVGINFPSGYTLDITENVSNYSVYSEFVDKYGIAPPEDVKLRVTVAPGVIVSADSTDLVAINFAGWWSGAPQLSLVNNGAIIGMGGLGGDGNGPDAGGSGGDAIELGGTTVAITNNGYIFGGGGGGGGGGRATGSTTVGSNTAYSSAGSGGGGGGPGAFSAAAGGPGVDAGYRSYLNINSNTINLPDATGTISFESVSLTCSQLCEAGTAGGMSGIAPTQGLGGVGTVTSGTTASVGGAGGNGAADFGEAGFAGQNGTTTGSSLVLQQTGAAGGAGGKAINLSGGGVTWISGNTAGQVKGAVS